MSSRKHINSDKKKKIEPHVINEVPRFNSRNDTGRSLKSDEFLNNLIKHSKKDIKKQNKVNNVTKECEREIAKLNRLLQSNPMVSKELQKIKPHPIQLINIVDANSIKKTNKKNTVNNHSKKKKIVKGTSTNSNREHIAASNKYKQEEGNIITEVNKEGKFIEDEHEELDSEKNSSKDNTDTAKKEIDINIEEEANVIPKHEQEDEKNSIKDLKETYADNIEVDSLELNKINDVLNTNDEFNGKNIKENPLSDSMNNDSENSQEQYIKDVLDNNINVDLKIYKDKEETKGIPENHIKNEDKIGRAHV